MGIIKEEVRIGTDRVKEMFDVDAKILVVEREEGELWRPFHIIQLSFDCNDLMTPRELRDFGAFCMREGRRIGREYTSSGRKKQKK